jgi:histone-lysine N-methyltransferase SETD3
MSSLNKVTLESLIDALLNESSKTFVDTTSLQSETDHFLKVYDLVCLIKAKEAARDSSDLVTDFAVDAKRREELLPAFLAWLDNAGVERSKVEIESVTHGLGLKVKQPLIGGEVAFTVPEQICITSIRARESKLQILAERDPMLRSMQNILLAVYLIYENYVTGNASFWKPYIDILPKVYDTTLCFTKDEVMLLKHSPSLFRETVKMFCNISRQYAYFHNIFRKGTDSASRALKSVFTFNRYVWAVSSVITRQNVVPSPEERSLDVLCLVPLWDLCNHIESGIISTDYSLEQKQFLCYASTDYGVGDEFKIFYGLRSSTDYFIHGGFVPGSRTDDFYCLELGIGTKDPNFGRKKALLSRLNMNCQSSFVLQPERLFASRTLFIFITIFQADKEKLDNIEMRMEMSDESLGNPSEKIWEFLATRFTLLKKASENSLANLIKSLFMSQTVCETNPVTTRVQMILQLLKNEQRLLELFAFVCNNNLIQMKTQSQYPQPQIESEDLAPNTEIALTTTANGDLVASAPPLEAQESDSTTNAKADQLSSRLEQSRLED